MKDRQKERRKEILKEGMIQAKLIFLIFLDDFMLNSYTHRDFDAQNTVHSQCIMWIHQERSNHLCAFSYLIWQKQSKFSVQLMGETLTVCKS